MKQIKKERERCGTNREAVESLLEELVCLDLCHARSLGTLPLDEDLTQLVRDLLKGETKAKKHIGALGVVKSVAKRVNTAAGCLEEKPSTVDTKDDPGAVRNVGASLVENSVRNTHCLLCENTQENQGQKNREKTKKKKVNPSLKEKNRMIKLYVGFLVCFLGFFTLVEKCFREKHYEMVLKEA